MLRTEEHYSQLKDVIGRIGMCEVLQALSAIAQGHSDTQAQNNLPIGASAYLAASLSELAARYEHERNFEINQRH